MGKKIEKELKRYVGLTRWEVQQGFWEIYDGSFKGAEVTVFVLREQPGAEQQGVWCKFSGAKAALELWRQMKHQNHFEYHDSFVDEQSRSLFVAVSRVEPLHAHLPAMCATELIVTLSDLSHALLHLHDTRQLSHNAVALSSLYVSTTGRRRCLLGDLQYAGPVDDTLSQSLLRSKVFRERPHPPEEEYPIAVTYKGSPVWTRDAYGIAKFVEDYLNAGRGQPGMNTDGELFHGWVHSALHEEGAGDRRSNQNVNAANGFIMQHEASLPPARPPIEDLLGSGYFTKCSLVKICAGLDLLPFHSVPGNKAALQAFFYELKGLLLHIPYSVLRSLVLPCIASARFWMAPGSSQFTPELFHESGCLLDASDQALVLSFVIKHLRAKNHGMTTPILKVAELVLAALPPEEGLDAVYTASVAAMQDRSADLELVYWGVHGVLASARYTLGGEQPSELQETLVSCLNKEVVPLLVKYTRSIRLSVKVRSSALLGYVQLVSLDTRITSTPLLPLLSNALLSGDDVLCHHALNAVIMAHSVLPYQSLAVDVLPLLATVMLTPNVKLREKCHQISSHILESLREQECEEEHEEFENPPLFKGCQLASPPVLSKDDKKYLQKKEKAGADDETGSLATTKGMQKTMLMMSEEEASEAPVDPTAYMDGELNEARVLWVGNEAHDTRTVRDVRDALLPRQPTEPQPKQKTGSRKKKGRAKKKGTDPVQPANTAFKGEEAALREWELRESLTGDAFSSLQSSLRNEENENSPVSTSGLAVGMGMGLLASSNQSPSSTMTMDRQDTEPGLQSELMSLASQESSPKPKTKTKATKKKKKHANPGQGLHGDPDFRTSLSSAVSASSAATQPEKPDLNAYRFPAVDTSDLRTHSTDDPDQQDDRRCQDSEEERPGQNLVTGIDLSFLSKQNPAPPANEDDEVVVAPLRFNSGVDALLDAYEGREGVGSNGKGNSWVPLTLQATIPLGESGVHRRAVEDPGEEGVREADANEEALLGQTSTSLSLSSSWRSPNPTPRGAGDVSPKPVKKKKKKKAKAAQHPPIDPDPGSLLL